MDDFISVLLSIVDNLPGKRDKHPVASQSLAPYQMSPWVAVLLFLFAGVIVGIGLLPSCRMAVAAALVLCCCLRLLHRFRLGKALHLTWWRALGYSTGFLGGVLLSQVIVSAQA